LDVTSPRLASLSFKPELIIAGGRHTILTEEGKDGCYVCGCNDHQQLGINSADPEVQVPLAVKLSGAVKKAAAGWDFSLVVLGTRMGLTLVDL
jgi:alpha-tubulin suppressor-like RCC1 family protein